MLHVIARQDSREFWETHADAEGPLRAWFDEAANAQWQSPQTSAPGPVDATRFRMDQDNLTAAELASLLGVSRRRVQDILNRHRTLTLRMIRLLTERLGISADVRIRWPASVVSTFGPPKG